MPLSGATLLCTVAFFPFSLGHPSPPTLPRHPSLPGCRPSRMISAVLSQEGANFRSLPCETFCIFVGDTVETASWPSDGDSVLVDGAWLAWARWGALGSVGCLRASFSPLCRFARWSCLPSLLTEADLGNSSPCIGWDLSAASLFLNHTIYT